VKLEIPCEYCNVRQRAQESPVTVGGKYGCRYAEFKRRTICRVVLNGGEPEKERFEEGLRLLRVVARRYHHLASTRTVHDVHIIEGLNSITQIHLHNALAYSELNPGIYYGLSQCLV